MSEATRKRVSNKQPWLERSDSSIPPTTITNNLPLVASLLAPSAIRFAHRTLGSSLRSLTSRPYLHVPWVHARPNHSARYVLSRYRAVNPSHTPVDPEYPKHLKHTEVAKIETLQLNPNVPPGDVLRDLPSREPLNFAKSHPRRTHVQALSQVVPPDAIGEGLRGDHDPAGEKPGSELVPGHAHIHRFVRPIPQLDCVDDSELR